MMECTQPRWGCQDKRFAVMHLASVGVSERKRMVECTQPRWGYQKEKAVVMHPTLVGVSEQKLVGMHLTSVGNIGQKKSIGGFSKGRKMSECTIPWWGI
ncbi:hypothetical protein Krac_2690 [Ktedonobacter racemifer DSM 44963]|uniref:Uncharacterized protein n=1 Tax=Ktedonobacter racemifer DSM 44963 TaxID=485913 RepID=D6TZE0_KTERA|nr:hypothetical protein Krac_2690 [Ktedonobacter racemifer DSM 44963]